MPHPSAPLAAPATADDTGTIADLARELAALPEWTTLVSEPGRAWREWRFKVPQSKMAIADILRQFAPRLYRFTAVRFADASLLLTVTPLEAPVHGSTADAKGK